MRSEKWKFLTILFSKNNLPTKDVEYVLNEKNISINSSEAKIIFFQFSSSETSS